ncbi:glycosidase, partial [Vibrio sp. V39_P1S14PM300]|nr:glycosidase [Vibrio sp. V39_P1S14PM300]
MQVRSEHPALYKGERRNLWIDDQLYVDLKVYDDEQIVYALNTGTAERVMSLDNTQLKAASHLVDLISGEQINLQPGITSVTVPALTGRLLSVR